MPDFCAALALLACLAEANYQHQMCLIQKPKAQCQDIGKVRREIEQKFKEMQK